MADIAKTAATREATAVSMIAANAGGDRFTNAGVERLVVQHTNSGGASATLTVTTTKTVDGLAVPDRQIVIAPGELYVLGPWPSDTYNDAEGWVELSWSAVTDIEIAVI